MRGPCPPSERLLRANHGRIPFRRVDTGGIIEPPAESLSQRELRNESGRVLRAVSEGRSFMLTNSGVPVGRIVPIDAPAPALTIARPARRKGGWAALAIQRKTATQSLAETLDDLRADRL